MGNDMRVLVVDDDRQMVKTISDILSVKGFSTSAAYTGEEAVERIQAEVPDCVIMDLKMPGIDGLSALKIIKSRFPRLPVVLMSAYATEEQVAEAKAEGAYAVLNKPIDIERVLSFLSLLRKEQSILVVDDDPVFSKTLKDILQSRGFMVETEADPGMVLDHMERSYQLVVLLDLKLGATSGLDVLHDIRTRYPTKPVVLVTGYGKEMTDCVSKGDGIGAYRCLYKPFEAEALIGTISEINRKKMRSLLGESFADELSAVT